MGIGVVPLCEWGGRIWNWAGGGPTVLLGGGRGHNLGGGLTVALGSSKEGPPQDKGPLPSARAPQQPLIGGHLLGGGQRGGGGNRAVNKGKKYGRRELGGLMGFGGDWGGRGGGGKVAEGGVLGGSRGGFYWVWGL